MRILLLAFLLSYTLPVCSNTVVINEIRANAQPGQLPNVEYIELYNNANEVADLAQISLKVNSKTSKLPSYLLAPKQYVVLCSKDAEPLLSLYGNALGLDAWSTLNNSGATLALLQNDVVIDEVSYKDSWHENSMKKGDGWSLERINPNWTCGLASNWSSSVSTRGGTPGSPNSVYNSKHSPIITIQSSRIEGNSVFISFNIPPNYLPDFSKAQFQLIDPLLTPTEVKWNSSEDSLELQFDEPLRSNKLYQLKVAPIACCGFKLSIAPYPLFKQGSIAYNAVVINEILFNPTAEGTDFIELYNSSACPINLQYWKLGNREIAGSPLLLEADDYLVLTADKSRVMQAHPNAIPDRIVQLPSLPAYPNQQGIVTLYSPTALIDSVYYNADMHASWVTNPKGISLERIDPNADSNEPINLRSAAMIVGGATPGYKNSLVTEDDRMENNFTLLSKTVSPDGDGFEDELQLQYQLQHGNYFINMHIYDDKGLLVKRLIRHEGAAMQGTISWDGRDDRNNMARPGHYIYWLEIYDESGFRTVFKSAFVLVHKST